MINEEPDVILFDNKSGVIYWVNCPAKVQEIASPQSSYLVYPLEGEKGRNSEWSRPKKI